MNEVQTIIGHHAALAALSNKERVIFSLKCTKEFYEKNKKNINLKEIKELKIISHGRIFFEPVCPRTPLGPTGTRLAPSGPSLGLLGINLQGLPNWRETGGVLGNCDY